MKTMLFNPYTGKPRDPRDIASDPAGTLIIDPDEPVQAAKSPRDCRMLDGRCGVCGGDWSVCGCQGALNRKGRPA